MSDSFAALTARSKEAAVAAIRGDAVGRGAAHFQRCVQLSRSAAASLEASDGVSAADAGHGLSCSAC